MKYCKNPTAPKISCILDVRTFDMYWNELLGFKQSWFSTFIEGSDSLLLRVKWSNFWNTANKFTKFSECFAKKIAFARFHENWLRNEMRNQGDPWLRSRGHTVSKLVNDLTINKRVKYTSGTSKWAMRTFSFPVVVAAHLLRHAGWWEIDCMRELKSISVLSVWWETCCITLKSAELF